MDGMTRYAVVVALALWLLVAVAGATGAFEPRPQPTPFPTPSCYPVQKGGPIPPCIRPLPLPIQE